MFNSLIEKLVEGYLFSRFTSQIAFLHAKLVGYRTDIALAIYAMTYLAQLSGLIDQAHAEQYRAVMLGAGGIAGLDKLTRYAPMTNKLAAALMDIPAKTPTNGNAQQ